MSNQERSPLYRQGYQEGQSEAEALLTQATHAKSAPLTKREISYLCNERLQSRIDGWRDGESSWPVIDDQGSGWCTGFTWACTQAERQAPNPDGFREAPPPYRPPEPTLEHPVPAHFREATIEVEDPEAFYQGIRQGQAAQVRDYRQMTSPHLLRALAIDVAKYPPKGATTDWLLGYLVGRVDAILRDRQYCPAGWREQTERSVLC